MMDWPVMGILPTQGTQNTEARQAPLIRVGLELPLPIFEGQTAREASDSVVTPSEK
jgi:hypothetical protein